MPRDQTENNELASSNLGPYPNFMANGFITRRALAVDRGIMLWKQSARWATPRRFAELRCCIRRNMANLSAI
jgi:hypothetical protein